MYYFTFPTWGDGGKISNFPIPYTRGTETQLQVSLEELKQAGILSAELGDLNSRHFRPGRRRCNILRRARGC